MTPINSPDKNANIIFWVIVLAFIVSMRTLYPEPAPPNIFADMWNIPAIQAAAPEMYRVLQRNLNDLEYIDYMCDSLGFPRFEVMRKEIEEVLEKARER